AILRGEAPDCSCLTPADAQSEFLRFAADHGVEGLVRRCLKHNGSWAILPSAVRTELDGSVQLHSVLELLRRRELSRILASLRNTGIRTLVLKGGALAYTHYPAPFLRPCLDIDLMIDRTDRDHAIAQLQNLGYSRSNSISRDSVHTQSLLVRSA